MPDLSDDIVVIGELPPDLRAALSAEFQLRDCLLEGPAALTVADLPRDCRAIATRAVVGLPAGLIERLPDLGLVLSLGAGLDRIDEKALADMLFNHVFVGTNDLERARAFYDAVMGALGVVNSASPDAPLLSYRAGGQGFAVRAPRNGEPATSANGGTIGFRAAGPEAVDAFHRAGLASGGSDDGPPGVRPASFGQPYIAYLRDPDGNKICATWKADAT